MIKASISYITLLYILILTSISGSEFKVPENTSIYKPSDKILVAAHRGLHSIYPENSIPAIRASILKDIDIVEIDIRETKDKVPILLHDANLKRTTHYDYNVSSTSLEQIQKLNLLYENSATPFKVPTLEDILKISKGEIILNLDFKINDLNAMKRTYALISKYKMENQIIFTVHDLQLIPELHRSNPAIRIMPVSFSSWKVYSALQYDFLDIIQLHHRAYSKVQLQKLEDQEVAIWINALNKFDDLEMAGQNGFEELVHIKNIDVIQTDHPEILLQFLQDKGLHD